MVVREGGGSGGEKEESLDSLRTKQTQWTHLKCLKIRAISERASGQISTGTATVSPEDTQTQTPTNWVRSLGLLMRKGGGGGKGGRGYHRQNFPAPSGSLTTKWQIRAKRMPVKCQLSFQMSLSLRCCHSVSAQCLTEPDWLTAQINSQSTPAALRRRIRVANQISPSELK